MSNDFTYYISDDGNISLINNNDGRTAYIKSSSPFSKRFKRLLSKGATFDEIVSLSSFKAEYKGKYSELTEQGSMFKINEDGSRELISDSNYVDFVRTTLYKNYGKPFYDNLVKALDMFTLRTDSDRVFLSMELDFLKTVAIDTVSGGVLFDNNKCGIFNKNTYSPSKVYVALDKYSAGDSVLATGYLEEEVHPFSELFLGVHNIPEITVPCITNKSSPFMEITMFVKMMYMSFWKEENIIWGDNPSLESISTNQNIQLKFYNTLLGFFEGIEKYTDYIMDCCITNPLLFLELVCGVSDIKLKYKEKLF